MNELIHLRKVNKRFNSDSALVDINLDLPRKGFIALVGESGSGKSTLLNLVSGLLSGFSGLAEVDGVNLGRLDEEGKRAFRLGRIGFLDQNVCLLDSETALANVEFPLDAIYGEPRKLRERRAKDLLRFVSVKELTCKNVNEMSGGQRQRVGLAVCLAANPKIVLADEPTAALDAENGSSVMEVLKKVSLNRLVIVVSHDENLLASFADRIIRLKDGKIVDDRKITVETKEGEVLALRLCKHKANVRPDWFSLLRHAAHNLGRRKIRSLFMLGSLVASFIGVSAGVYLTDSIENEVSGAFSSIVPPGRIVMEKKGGGEVGYEGLTAASELQVMTLEDTYPQYILGSGSTLLFDFSSLFVSGDSFSFLRSSKRIEFPSFSARNINEFLWLEETYPEVFPSFPISMELDEVVVGLPFADMAALCFDLGIERDYESLGELCRIGGLRLLVQLDNDEIDFHNDDLFSVVGVVKSEAPCFYHLNRKWNEEYFLDHLNFRSSISSDTLNPQSVFALPYIVLKTDPEEALKAFREGGFTEGICFDFSLPGYLSSLTSRDWERPSKRAYLYSVSNYNLNVNNTLNIAELDGVNGLQLCSNASYLSYIDNLVSGFANAFYLSNSYDDVFLVGETASRLAKSDPLTSLSLPESVKDGNYLSASRGGLHLSSDFTGLKEEELPQNLREIVISSSLEEFWGRPQNLYAAIEYIDPLGSNSRKIAFFEFVVKGVKSCSTDTIFVPSFWINDFFATQTPTSGLSLLPNNAVIYCDEEEEASLLEALSKQYPDYQFVNPTSLIDMSFGGATEYISLVLIVFSSILFLLSIVVFAYAISLYRIELSGEWRYFRLLGLSEKDEKRSLYALCLLLTLLGLLPSLIGLAMVEFLGHLFIAASFNTASHFVFSFLPFVVMVGLAIFFLALALVLTRSKSLKPNRQN